MRDGSTKVQAAELTDDNFDEVARARGYVPHISMNRFIRSQKFAVDEIIDVGVYAGTQWLYQTYKDARFVLVEPLPEGEQLLERPPRNYTFLNKALGATPGRMTINRMEAGRLSTFLEWTELVTHAVTEKIEVPIDTLDNVIATVCTSDRIGIKIDTEGFERDVIAGLTKDLHRVVFVVAEVSIIERHKGGYRFGELVADMHAKGFHFLNILNMSQLSPKFYDVLFVREDDPRLVTPAHRLDL